MIKLQLTSPATSFHHVTALRSSNYRKFCQRLSSITSSPHVRCHSNSVDVVGMFDSRNRVPDVDRYRITFQNGVFRLSTHKHGQIASSDNQFCDHKPSHVGHSGTILLLLESPHKCEYLNGDPRNPVAPAQGQTGKRIDSCLEHILNAQCNAHVMGRINSGSRVIVANPVQFQTSLWTIHRESLRVQKTSSRGGWEPLRNAVWKTLWDVNQIQKDFLCRLQFYCPDVVLNCCTSKLRKQVSCALCQCGLAPLTCEVPHPSTW